MSMAPPAPPEPLRHGRKRRSAFDAVFRKEVLINLRDPLLLVMMFVVPLVLVVFLTGAVGGAFTSHAPAYVAAGSLPQSVEQRVGKPEAVVSPAEARRRVANGEVPVALLAGADGRLTVVADPTSTIAVPPMLAALDDTPPTVETPTGQAYADGSSPFAQTLLGFVMFHAFFAAAHAAQALHRERNWGTWNRLLSLPVGRLSLLTAKLLPVALISALQGLLLIGGGALLLGIPISHPLLFIITNLAIGMCVGSVGAAVAALASNDAQVPQFNNLIVLMGGAVSGAMVPLLTLPGWAQSIAPVFPQYWAMELLKDTTARASTAGHVLVHLAVLVAYAIALLALGFRFMRWDRFRHE
jgi:ABC-2 type transport system permease protein